jgi:hypothetical protein
LAAVKPRYAKKNPDYGNNNETAEKFCTDFHSIPPDAQITGPNNNILIMIKKVKNFRRKYRL